MTARENCRGPHANFNDCPRDYPTQPGGFVYCHSETHQAIDCDRLTTVDDRRKHLAKNRLYFNCAQGLHRASECKSFSACHKCQRKHHTSICDQRDNQLLTASCNENRSACYPVVVVVGIDGIKCRALLDTGAGSSYASSGLIDMLKIKSMKVERRRIEMERNGKRNVKAVWGKTSCEDQRTWRCSVALRKHRREPCRPSQQRRIC